MRFPPTSDVHFRKRPLPGPFSLGSQMEVDDILVVEQLPLASDRSTSRLLVFDVDDVDRLHDSDLLPGGLVGTPSPRS